MMFKVVRITVALALGGLVCTSVSFAARQDTAKPSDAAVQATTPSDPANQVAQADQEATRTPLDPKAAAKAAKEEKAAKAAADKKAKEEAKQAAKGKPKNSDIDNIGNRDINKGSINFMSYEKEIAMGRELAAQVEREVKLVQDPTINEYVNRVGQNLVRNSDAKVPFTIKVVESDEINAFALPGGFFYVNSGLILAADNEAELAGVMAHEIAHVTARHGSENYSKGTLLNIATIPLIFVAGPAGMAARQMTGLMIPVAFYSFSRKAEAEADYLGLQYMYKTGYDPTAAVSFFEKLEAKETAKPGTVSKLFATHPLTGDRIEMEKKNIEKVLPDKDEYVVTTSEFNKVKGQLAMLESNRRPSEDDNNNNGKPSLRRTTTSTRGGGNDGGNAPPRTTRTTTSSGSSSGSSTDSTDSTSSTGSSTDSKDSTTTASPSDTTSTDSSTTDNPDDDRPVLKRRP